MTETRFYEPARLSTLPKPLFLLTPLDAQPGWGHCYRRSSAWETGSSQCGLELHHGTVWGWIFRTSVRNVGSLSNDDENGRENVATKMNLYPIKLCRVYVDPLNLPLLPDRGEFSWSWILKDFVQVLEEKGKFVVVCSPPALNVALGGFTQ